MKKSVYLLFVIGHLLLTTESVVFPKEWCRRIRNLLEEFGGNSQYLSTSINVLPSDGQPYSCPITFVMPPCILWSPVEQYPSDYTCPKCTSNLIDLQMTLRPARWQDGSNPQSTPRKIHGVDGPIIVISRVYRCPKGHEVLGYHPNILSQVPLQEVIPFALWHRTGFTHNLLELVQSLVLAGISISAIANTLENNRYKMYFRFKNMYHKIHTYLNAPEMPFLTVNQFEDLFGTELTPSRHSISNIFLTGFWKHEHLYVTEMKKTTVSKTDGWLCCDHTFASVSK